VVGARPLAAVPLLALSLAGVALAPRVGLISHGGAGAVAEFDDFRIHQP
jgi:hypothetical protein